MSKVSAFLGRYCHAKGVRGDAAFGSGRRLTAGGCEDGLALRGVCFGAAAWCRGRMPRAGVEPAFSRGLVLPLHYLGVICPDFPPGAGITMCTLPFS